MWQPLTFLIFNLTSSCLNSDQAVIGKQTLEISSRCRQQVEEYLSTLKLSEDSWAFRMLDASAKLPPGLFSLTKNDAGNFDQCIEVETTSTLSGAILGKYCLGSATEIKSSTYEPLRDLIEPRRLWAICLPDSCTVEDVSAIGNCMYRRVQGPMVQLEFSEYFCQTAKDVNTKLTKEAIVVICFFVVLLLVVVVATIIEVYLKKEDRWPIVKAFSMYTNGRNIFKTTSNTNQLPCLDGLKCITALLIICAHVYVSFMENMFVVNIDAVLKVISSRFASMMYGLDICSDTFFVIAGTLVSFNFMQSRGRNKTFNIFSFYLRRILRITPSLAAVVVIYATILPFLGSGPLWPLIKKLQFDCIYLWWASLLYINNYVYPSNMCFPGTWYLSVDMQLYFLSPLLLFMMWKRVTFCFSILLTLLFGAIVSSFYVAWVYDMRSHTIPSSEYLSKYYFPTHTRCTPWLVGAILGYILFKIKDGEKTFRMNKGVVVIGWIAFWVTLAVFTSGGHSLLKDPGSGAIIHAFYIALARPIWSVALSWLILACSTNYGGPVQWLLSLPIFKILSKLTFGTYVVHGAIINVLRWSKKKPYYFNHLDMATAYLGITLWSIFFGTLVVLLIEQPLTGIENILRKKMRSLAGRSQIQLEEANKKIK